MLRYLTVPVTPFQQNCSLVWCEATRKPAVIDPGGDLEVLLAETDRLGFALEQIWLTHAHIDHAGGTGELAQRLSLPIVGPHTGDQFWIDGLPQQSAMFGFPPAQHFTPTRWLHDGDTVQIGNETLNVRHWCSTRRRLTGPLWVMCCLRAASAARISRRAITRI